ncbi:MAG: hypothetical protein QF357_11170 [Dehalococcoidia bacterium]|jgi:hypothetical protein|nr:hypothetical protein [Dehalococcoidia bacterium]
MRWSDKGLAERNAAIRKSLIDTLAPRTGPKQRRVTLEFTAKTTFYVSVTVFFVFFIVAFVMYDQDRELDVIPATRDGPTIINEVRVYLQTATHRGFSYREEEQICWDVFKDQTFSVNYLLLGSWQVNAWYRTVRYFWRVDDKTLEVTQDHFFQTTNPTIDC